MIIDSIQNKHIKLIKKILTSKYQKKEQKYLIEGRNLVDEAIHYQEPLEILATEQAAAYLSGSTDHFTLISEQVAKYLSSTVTPEGIFAVMPIRQETPQPGNWLIFDELQDPGNAGTILRTADFFDYQGVFFSPKSVSPYSPKVLRSAQGSNFHLQVVIGPTMPFIEQLKSWGELVLGTTLHEQAKEVQDLDLNEPYALVLGNEGHGLSKEIGATIDENILIPTKGHAESLNVSVAAGILMYALNIINKN
ncbi:TrmH family RNA methyltransferase [Xylocopilactobacillus apicola]|uniref:23S rRNA methyltransferase n=1 Tax=Xylocopilactobacillus apicola TaxID=2932184 RepID=A0AAU9DQY4_9LACO|nr:RNA methyltransferase [Xylocopilactobacillus apicola]BDR58324.1 23S rRNA methyltransferase [Xylocopilactobacillus apicola]